MFEENKISLVIPALNEQEGIAALLADVPAYVDEVIVVDNGSSDRTAAISEYSGATVIHERHRGYGASLRTGIASCTGDIVICLDADGSYPVSAIEGFLRLLLDEGYDFVSGRRITAGCQAMPLINKISNRCISALIRRFFGISLHDSQSGMWAFRKEIFRKIAPKSYGMGFSQEIKIRAHLDPALRCREADIFYDKRRGGISKFNKLRDTLLVLQDTFSIYREYHGFLQYKRGGL